MDIAIRHLSKSYGAVAALTDVSLTITPGQVVALLGANGAGKTTLLRCLAGVAAPDDGEIRYDDEVFRRDRVDLRKRFAFLPDAPFVYPGMSVLNHIGMVLAVYETPTDGIEDRVVGLLRDFELLALADVPFSRLSRGQAYKGALVALLAADPELWMLDEPYGSGMDPHGIAAFRWHAARAAERGRTVIYSTQLLELAEHHSDRVGIVHRGKVYAFESVESLRLQMATGDGVLDELFQWLREPAV